MLQLCIFFRRTYESWGGVLLGLGLCILLVCLILCIHAYCVMAADASDEEGNSDPADKSNPVRDTMQGRRLGGDGGRCPLIFREKTFSPMFVLFCF